MDEIKDQSGNTYTVPHSTLQDDGTVIYYTRSGDEAIARALVPIRLIER